MMSEATIREWGIFEESGVMYTGKEILSLLIFFVDPCELACLSSGLVLTWHGLVADGNRCTNRPDIFDVCIAGKCRVRKNKVFRKKFE